MKLISFFSLLFLISVALSLFQMLIELIISPVVSFCVIVVIYVISGYYMSNYLLGNYIMLLRYEQMDIRIGVILAVVIIIISVLSGWFVMKKRDLM